MFFTKRLRENFWIIQIIKDVTIDNPAYREDVIYLTAKYTIVNMWQSLDQNRIFEEIRRIPVNGKPNLEDAVAFFVDSLNARSVMGSLLYPTSKN